MSVDCALYIGYTVNLKTNLKAEDFEFFCDFNEYDKFDCEGRTKLLIDGMNGDYARLIFVDKKILDIWECDEYIKLRLCFLKLCVDDTDVLTRIADVIQLNINQALTESGYTHPKKGSFLMSEAYTYIQIEADVRLKTMFISLPFFTEYAEDGASYFKIKYKSVLGY